MTPARTRLYPPYVATQKRSPLRPLIPLPQTASELTGPTFAPEDVGPGEEDLTRQHHGEPVGQRILLAGRVLDGVRPVPGTLIELWQANAAGRYRHVRDQYLAPLDPNFTGAGRTLTDREGRYRFVTIVPGPYPWRNHFNAWRPAHIHFSVFGPSFATRLVTQMYFEGDPLLAVDPIFNSIGDSAGRDAMIAHLDWETSEEYHALGYRYDQGPDMHFLSAGLGYIAKEFSVEASVRRGLADRLLRVLIAMLRTRTPYDPQRAVAAA